MVYKGVVSSITDKHKAVVIPDNAPDAVTCPLMIPKRLYGVLSVGMKVIYTFFGDNTGQVIESLDDYDLPESEGSITSLEGSAPISVTGTGASRMISHGNSGVSPGSYGNTNISPPDFGENVNVPYITLDAKGHITEAKTQSFQLPKSLATSTRDGLMSMQDKDKLDNLDTSGGPSGPNMADWILEKGTIDGWSYEKWNSGKAVIWIARLNITFPAATAWGSTGINKQIGTFSFPTIFINTPFVFGSIAGAIDVAAAPRVYALSATTGEAEHLRRTASAGTTGYSILAIGQWK